MIMLLLLNVIIGQSILVFNISVIFIIQNIQLAMLCVCKMDYADVISS